MPTEKFLNLSETKKRAILTAVREEFLTHSYSELRVTAMIRRAGISRASFYLYFQDKEDLFLCMLEQLNRQLEEGLLQCFREEGGDFYRAMMRMLEHTLAEENAVYGLVMKRAQEDSSCSDITRQLERRLFGARHRSEFADRCVRLLDAERYPQADREGCCCAIDMGVVILVQALNMKIGGGDPQAIRNLAQRQFEILEYGLRAKRQA